MTESPSTPDNAARDSATELEFADRAAGGEKTEIVLAHVTRVDFLAKLSHEIRTPIAAILGFAELLVPHDDGDQEKISAIRRNAKKLIELINNILDLSKVEAGQLKVHRESLSPAQLLEELRSSKTAEASQKSLKLSVLIDNDVPLRITSDPIRLRQILMNLVANAIQFTDQGSIVLSTRLIAKSKQICFEVIDTGIGISAEQQTRLFMSYEQGGSGLGLVLGQRLAHALGGKITVRSEIGRGSAFAILLPCEPVDETKHVAVSATGANKLEASFASLDDAACAQRECPRLRVFVVDDRRDSRHLLKQFIERSGDEVVVAENGRQALEVMAGQTSGGEAFDLVLMDLQMPELDGLETTRQLRSLGHVLPIIALTASSRGDEREHCLQAGFTDFLTKPIALTDWDRVRNAYGGNSAARRTRFK